MPPMLMSGRGSGLRLRRSCHKACFDATRSRGGRVLARRLVKASERRAWRKQAAENAYPPRAGENWKDPQ